MSLSMQQTRSPRRHISSDRSDSPVRRRSSPRRRSPSRRERSPDRNKSSPRKRSPVRTSSSHRVKSPTKEKSSTRGRSPKYGRSVSSASRSPSPHTKRLKRAQADREVDRLPDRERERNNVRESDRGRHRERGVDREAPSDRERGVDKEEIHSGKTERSDRSERRSTRDRDDKGSSRSRHGRSTSPTDRGQRIRHSSRSPLRAGARDEVSYPRESEQTWDDNNDNNDSVAKMKATQDALEEKQKQKPSFELSGKLAAETNRVRGVTLLFNEPPDARKPDIRWRLYVFKGGEVLNEPLYVHRQSCYLFGRERRVADIPTDHPSCSKQHAVIQFRQVEKEQPVGTLSKQPRVCNSAREFSRVIGIGLPHRFLELPLCDFALCYEGPVIFYLHMVPERFVFGMGSGDAINVKLWILAHFSIFGGFSCKSPNVSNYLLIFNTLRQLGHLMINVQTVVKCLWTLSLYFWNCP